MTGTEISTYIRYGTRTNSVSFPDAEMVSLGNAKIDSMAREIEKANADYFGSVETTDLLVTATTREYPFPQDMLSRIKYLEVCFDGTNWVKVEGMDLSTYQRTTDESEIQLNFGSEEGDAFFDIFRGSIWLYSDAVTTQVDNGIKLWLFTYPAKLTTDKLSESTDLSIDPSTTSHGFPRQFHELLADAIIIKYKNSKDKPLGLTEREQMWQIRMDEALESIKNIDMDTAQLSSVPDQDDSDDGYEY